MPAASFRAEEELRDGPAAVAPAAEDRPVGVRRAGVAPALLDGVTLRPGRGVRGLCRERPDRVAVSAHHFERIRGIGADAQADAPALASYGARDEGHVHLRRRAALEAPRGGGGGLAVERVEHDAGRRVVELVHGPQAVRGRGALRAEEGHQVRLAGVLAVLPRVDAHVEGLINRHVPVVLVDQRQSGRTARPPGVVLPRPPRRRRRRARRARGHRPRRRISGA